MVRAFLSLAGLLLITAPAFAQLPPLKPVVLAKSEVAADGKYAGDKYILTGGGRESNGGTDEGAFAGIETNLLNFTLIARVASVEGGGKVPKYGLSLRAGTTGTEKAVHLRYDGYEGHKCLQWFMRYHAAPTDHDGGRRAFLAGIEKLLDKPSGVWMKLVRRYPYVTLFASCDGKSWQKVGADTSKILMPQKVHVGLQVTAGDPKTPLTVTFDNLSFIDDSLAPDASSDSPAAQKEYVPQPSTHRMYLAAVTPDRGAKDDAFTAFLLMPRNMDPRKIKAVLWSTGSKEFMAGGKPFSWTKGEGAIRIPAGTTTTSGFVDIEDIEPFYSMLEHYGVVRLGGF